MTHSLNLKHINAALYDNSDTQFIILCSADKCDAARALSQVLNAIVDLNMQESDEVDEQDEKDYERRSRAESFLFALANDLTSGYRDVNPLLDLGD